MTEYSKLSRAELEALKAELLARYEEYKSLGLKLDMSRGKPGVEQLAESAPLMDVLGSDSDMKSAGGVDCRNYGGFDGLPEVRAIFAEMLGVPVEMVIAGGNASLNLMFDAVAQGVYGGYGCGSWASQGEVKFLCPVPGYDRHFAVTEYFGIKMINVDMTPDGPDMDTVEKLVSSDPSIKGIWCVPMYSNPQGYTYSDETVRRFANLKPAAKDFRIFWDNAYCVHHFRKDRRDSLLNLMDECIKTGNEDLPFIFASTSKISYPGAGVAVMAASKANRVFIDSRLKIQTIGPDKLNHLRHARYFVNAAGIDAHMVKMAKHLEPRFDAVLNMLNSELSGTGAAEWTEPVGGYFVSVDVNEGCAKRVVSLCKEAGVTLTEAGASFPYHNDPKDTNIRLAPSFPSVEELTKAMEIFCLAAKLAAVEKHLA